MSDPEDLLPKMAEGAQSLARHVGADHDIEVARRIASAFYQHMPDEARNIDVYAALALIIAHEAEKLDTHVATPQYSPVSRILLCGALSMVVQYVGASPGELH